MRHFSYLSRGKALDSEAGIQCVATGLAEDYESLEMYSSINHLSKKDNFGVVRSFWVMKPFQRRIKNDNGVKLIVNFLGGPKGCPIPNVIKLKGFCEFTEDDFSFLQYLASAVVNIETETQPYRSLLLASRLEMEEVTGRIQIQDYGPGMLLLGDSKDQFV